MYVAVAWAPLLLPCACACACASVCACFVVVCLGVIFDCVRLGVFYLLLLSGSGCSMATFHLAMDTVARGDDFVGSVGEALSVLSRHFEIFRPSSDDLHGSISYVH